MDGEEHSNPTNLSSPLMVRVNPVRLYRVAKWSAAFGVFLLLASRSTDVSGDALSLPTWAFFILSCAAFAFAALNVGIARARPTALRIDEFGVSGFYIPTLSWSEIKSVNALSDLQGDWHGFSKATIIEVGPRLVFDVYDMHALRMRQPNAWSRLKLLGGQVILSGSVLDGDLERITAMINYYHAANIRIRAEGTSKQV